MARKTDMGVNLTIASFSVRCAVKQHLMLSAFHPPFMDPVMDTASEGFTDGQAAHLLKRS